MSGVSSSKLSGERITKRLHESKSQIAKRKHLSPIFTTTFQDPKSKQIFQVFFFETYRESAQWLRVTLCDRFSNCIYYQGCFCISNLNIDLRLEFSSNPLDVDQLKQLSQILLKNIRIEPNILGVPGSISVNTIQDSSFSEASQHVDFEKPSEKQVKYKFVRRPSVHFMEDLSNTPRLTSADSSSQDVKLSSSLASPRVSSCKFDVTGALRRSKISIPSSIRVSRAPRTPNTKYSPPVSLASLRSPIVPPPLTSRDEMKSMTSNTNRPETAPIQRYISDSRPSTKGSLPIISPRSPAAPLFHVLPSHMRFGELHQGLIYRSQAILHNVGSSLGRYRLPPKRRTVQGNWIKVIGQPGSIAPGISVTLEIEISAVSVGIIEDCFQITTETDIFSVPVSAWVVSKSNSRESISIGQTSAHNAVIIVGEVPKKDMLIQTKESKKEESHNAKDKQDGRVSSLSKSSSKRGNLVRTPSLHSDVDFEEKSQENSPNSNQSVRKLSKKTKGSFRIPSLLTAAHFRTHEKLSRWLKERGVDTSLWGRGMTKSVQKLFREMSEDDVVIQRSTPPLRVVKVVSVKIWQDNPQRFLVETHQQDAEGSIRIRNRLLAEKMHNGESVPKAARRGILEELGGLVKGIQTYPATISVHEETNESPSYPNLYSRYILHTIVARVQGLPNTPFNTDETNSDGSTKYKHFWKWRTTEQIEEMLALSKKTNQSNPTGLLTNLVEANPSRLPSIRQFTLKDTKNRRRSENPNIALEEEEDSDDSEGSVDMLLFDLPCSVLRNDGAIKKVILRSAMLRWQFSEDEIDRIFGEASAWMSSRRAELETEQSDDAKSVGSDLELEEEDWILRLETKTIIRLINDAVVLEIPGSDGSMPNLPLNETKVLRKLYPRCCRVKIRQLHGGFSGSRVLQVQSYDKNGQPEEPSVVKIDSRENIWTEKRGFESIEPLIGENAPYILKWIVDREDEGTKGGIKFQLAGACWCLPELIGTSQNLLNTFKDLFLWDAKLAHREASRSSVSGSLLSQPGRESPLGQSLSSNTLVLSTHRGLARTQSDIPAQQVYGDVVQVLQEVFGEILYQATKVRATIKKIDLVEEYQIERLLHKHVFSRPAGIEPASLSELDDGRLVSKWVGGPAMSVVEYMNSFWEDVQKHRKEENVLVGLVHGDLNGCNILIDSEQIVWIIDFANTNRAHVLMDLAKLENTILYEYSLVESPSDEKQAEIITNTLGSVQDLKSQLPSSEQLGLVGKFELAWTAIRVLREFVARYVQNCATPAHMSFSLFHYALKTLSFRDISSAQKKWALSAALTHASRIQQHLKFLSLNEREKASDEQEDITIEENSTEKDDEAEENRTRATILRNFEPLSVEEFSRERARYSHAIAVRHSFIVDPISRENLDLNAQCVSLAAVEGSNKFDLLGKKQEMDLIVEKRLASMRLVGKRKNQVSKSDSIKGEDKNPSVDAINVLLPAPGEPSRRVVVLGAAASGKTCLLRKALLLASQATGIGVGEGSMVPILILLIDLGRFMAKYRLDGSYPLVQLFLRDKYGEFSNRYRFLAQALGSRRVLLMLDGLDEAGDLKEAIESYISTKLVDEVPYLVVSSRHTDFKENVFKDFRFIQVMPLTPNMQDMIVETRLGKTNKLLPQIKAELRTHRYAELAQSPLMLSLLISTFRTHGSVKSLTRAELYDRGIRQMLHRTDAAKHFMRRGHGDKLIEKDLKKLASEECHNFLTHLAFCTHQRRVRDIMSHNLVECLTYMKVDEDHRYIDLLNILQRSVLQGLVPLFMCVQENYESTGPSQIMRFAHLTFQEYLAGKYIADRLIEAHKLSVFEEKLQDIFTEREHLDLVHDAWWQQVVLLCAGSLPAHVFIAFAECLLNWDDITGANACLVQEMLAERSTKDGNVTTEAQTSDDLTSPTASPRGKPSPAQARMSFLGHRGTVSQSNRMSFTEMASGKGGIISSADGERIVATMLQRKRPVEWLLQALMHPSQDLRALAITEVSQFSLDKSALATAIMEALLGDKSHLPLLPGVSPAGSSTYSRYALPPREPWYIRGAALQSLGFLGVVTPEVVRFLASYLADPIPQVRSQVVEAIGLLGAQNHDIVVDAVVAMINFSITPDDTTEPTDNYESSRLSAPSPPELTNTSLSHSTISLSQQSSIGTLKIYADSALDTSLALIRLLRICHVKVIIALFQLIQWTRTREKCLPALLSALRTRGQQHGVLAVNDRVTFREDWRSHVVKGDASRWTQYLHNNSLLAQQSSSRTTNNSVSETVYANAYAIVTKIKSTSEENMLSFNFDQTKENEELLVEVVCSEDMISSDSSRSKPTLLLPMTFIEDQVTTVVLYALKSAFPHPRQVTCNLLKENPWMCEPQQVRERLYELIHNDAVFDVRVAALHALYCSRGKKSALNVLLSWLRKSEDHIKRQNALSLAREWKIDEDRLISAIVSLLEESTSSKSGNNSQNKKRVKTNSSSVSDFDRCDALMTLATIPKARELCQQHILKLLKPAAGSSILRKAAIGAIAIPGVADEQIVSALLHTLTDNDWEVRKCVLESLAAIPKMVSSQTNLRTVSRVIKHDGNIAVCTAALGAALALQEALPEEESNCESDNGNEISDNKFTQVAGDVLHWSVRDAVLAWLSHPRVEVKRCGIAACQSTSHGKALEDASVVSSLFRLLHHDDGSVRKVALTALLESRAPLTNDQVLEYLADPRSDVKRAALLAIADHRLPSILLDSVNQKSSNDLSLQKTRESSFFLAQNSSSDGKSLVSIPAEFKLSDRQLLLALFRVLKDNDRVVRHTALTILQRSLFVLEVPKVLYYLREINPEIREAATTFLCRPACLVELSKEVNKSGSGWDLVIQALNRILTASHGHTTREAQQLMTAIIMVMLGNYLSSSISEQLITWLNHTSPRFRKAAAYTIQSVAIVMETDEHVLQMIEGKSQEICLDWVHKEEIKNALCHLLDDEEPSVQEAALDALLELGHCENASEAMSDQMIQLVHYSVSVTTRVKAVNALYRIGIKDERGLNRKRILSALVNRLSVEHSEVQSVELSVLVALSLADEMVLQALVEVLNSSESRTNDLQSLIKPKQPQLNWFEQKIYHMLFHEFCVTEEHEVITLAECMRNDSLRSFVFRPLLYYLRSCREKDPVGWRLPRRAEEIILELADGSSKDKNASRNQLVQSQSGTSRRLTIQQSKRASIASSHNSQTEINAASNNQLSRQKRGSPDFSGTNTNVNGKADFISKHCVEAVFLAKELKIGRYEFELPTWQKTHSIDDIFDIIPWPFSKAETEYGHERDREKPQETINKDAFMSRLRNATKGHVDTDAILPALDAPLISGSRSGIYVGDMERATIESFLQSSMEPGSFVVSRIGHRSYLLSILHGEHYRNPRTGHLQMFQHVDIIVYGATPTPNKRHNASPHTTGSRNSSMDNRFNSSSPPTSFTIDQRTMFPSLALLLISIQGKWGDI